MKEIENQVFHLKRQCPQEHSFNSNNCLVGVLCQIRVWVTLGEKNKRDPLSEILKINFSKIFLPNTPKMYQGRQLAASHEGWKSLLAPLLQNNKASALIALKTCHCCHWLLSRNVHDICLSACYFLFFHKRAMLEPSLKIGLPYPISVLT